MLLTLLLATGELSAASPSVTSRHSSFADWLLSPAAIVVMTTVLQVRLPALWQVAIVTLQPTNEQWLQGHKPACVRYRETVIIIIIYDKIRVALSQRKPLHRHCTTTLTRMWANAQRDGRPAKYRWRPVLNAATVSYTHLTLPTIYSV